MASKGVNKAIILGNLTDNPTVRYMPNGGAVTNIAVATNEEWRDKESGEKKSKAEYHRVVIFGKLAEIAGEYLKKGSQVYIEGQLQTRKWQDQSGQDRYSTEIVVNIGGIMQILGGRSNTNDSNQQQPKQQNQQANNSQPADFDDGIPFSYIGLQYPNHSIHSI